MVEYDTKSSFLKTGAQKDVQAMCKALKISVYISPMLHKNYCMIASVKVVTPLADALFFSIPSDSVC